MKFHGAVIAIGSLLLCIILAPTVTDAHTLCWNAAGIGGSTSRPLLLSSVLAAISFLSIPTTMAQVGSVQEYQEEQENLHLRRREQVACCVCIRAPCDCACDTPSTTTPTDPRDDVKPAGDSTSFPFPLDTLPTSAASFPLGFGFPANRPEGSGIFTPEVGPSLGGFGSSLDGFGPSLDGFGPSLDGFGSSLDGFGPSLGVFNGNVGDVTEPSDSSTPMRQGIFPEFSGPYSCLNPPCLAIGRPFVDAEGLEITSDASICDTSAWTTTFAIAVPKYETKQQQQHGHQSPQNDDID
jgi:hypothetical protein